MHNYSQDGAKRYGFNAPSVRCTHRTRSAARPLRAAAVPAGGWETDGELMRAAATLHAEDNDFGQAGTLYREVFDDAAKARFSRPSPVPWAA